MAARTAPTGRAGGTLRVSVLLLSDTMIGDGDGICLVGRDWFRAAQAAHGPAVAGHRGGLIRV